MTCFISLSPPSVLMDLKQKRNSHHGSGNDSVEISAESVTKHSCVELGPRTCSTSAIHLHTSTPISRLPSRTKGVHCIWSTSCLYKSGYFFCSWVNCNFSWRSCKEQHKSSHSDFICLIDQIQSFPYFFNAIYSTDHIWLLVSCTMILYSVTHSSG